MKSSISLGMLACVFPLLLLFPSCSSTKSGSQSTSKVAITAKSLSPSAKSTLELGIASIYTDKRTASGQRYSASAMAAAHKSLPLGSKVKVTNLRNGKTCVVKIHDRGPYKKGRIIDLTPTAAKSIGLSYHQGLTKVRLEKL